MRKNFAVVVEGGGDDDDDSPPPRPRPPSVAVAEAATQTLGARERPRSAGDTPVDDEEESEDGVLSCAGGRCAAHDDDDDDGGELFDARNDMRGAASGMNTSNGSSLGGEFSRSSRVAALGAGVGGGVDCASSCGKPEVAGDDSEVVCSQNRNGSPSSLNPHRARGVTGNADVDDGGAATPPPAGFICDDEEYGGGVIAW